MMSNNTNSKNPLLGCFEISLFMKTGINHFDSEMKAMWRSFIVVGLTLLFTLLTSPYIHEAKIDFQDNPVAFTTFLYGIKYVVQFLAILLFTYYFCKIVKRKKNFVRFITTSNWCSIITLIVFIPIYVFLVLGNGTYDDVYPILVAISLYAYALAAFVTRYVIDIPWELAVFMTVCVLAINEAGFKLLYYFVG